MSDSVGIRLDLARGHWSLGEHEEAIGCLERALEPDQGSEPVRELLETLLEEIAETQLTEPNIETRLRTLRARCDAALAPAETRLDPVAALSPLLATPTMAELLADQGHTERAYEFAQDLLRRNPADERAAAVHERLRPSTARGQGEIAVLERWLEYFQQRPQGSAQT